VQGKEFQAELELQFPSEGKSSLLKENFLKEVKHRLKNQG
jgi:hypothetical protein